MININKYIAKYDFDIAQKLKAITRLRNKDAETYFKRQVIYEILEICSFEFSKNETIYQSIWDIEGKQINDLDDVPANCHMLIMSELPMHDTSYLQIRRERGLACSQDYQTHDQKLIFDRSAAA
jgi:hypothetical protein